MAGGGPAAMMNAAGYHHHRGLGLATAGMHPPTGITRVTSMTRRKSLNMARQIQSQIRYKVSHTGSRLFGHTVYCFGNITLLHP